MKKIAVFLLVMISVMVVVGCNNSRKTVTRFSTDKSDETAAESESGPTTTITRVDEEKKAAPPAIPLAAPASEEEKKDEKDATTTEKKTSDEPGVKFAVTSIPGTSAQSKKGYNLIEGVTPKETAKIEVNGTPLSKYKAGETKWSYIAAVSLGNLKNGSNPFTVRALDAKGKELGSKTFTIEYKGAEMGSLAATGASTLPLSLLITLVGMGALSLRRRSA